MQHLTELQLIQAQVNPHFLYNTLDTIVWLIEGGMTAGCSGYDHQSVCFFPHFTFQEETISSRSRKKKRHTLSYLEIQQSQIPGYSGI